MGGVGGVGGVCVGDVGGAGGVGDVGDVGGVRGVGGRPGWHVGGGQHRARHKKLFGMVTFVQSVSIAHLHITSVTSSRHHLGQ